MFLHHKNPSKSAVERDNPPPRRKSCQGCIKAKRRCDLGSPKCLRCSHRQIECQYDSSVSANSYYYGDTPSGSLARSRKRQTHATGGQAASEQPTSSPLTPSATLEPTTNADVLCFLDDPSLITSPNFENGPFGAFPASKTTEFVAKDDGIFDLATPLDSLLEGSYPTYGDLHLDTLQASPLTMDPVPARQQESPNTDLMYLPVPNPTTLRTSLNLPHIIRTHLSYTISILRNAPTTFVETTGTPWSHPSLYKDGLPPIIEDLYSACALYMARSSRNDAVIMRSIQHRLAKLVKDPLPSASSILDILNRTQALLMYQIMRTLDDGLTRRADDAIGAAALEEAMNTLKEHLIIEADSTDVSTEFMLSTLTAHFITDCEKAAALQVGHRSIRRPTEPLPLYPLGPTRAFWEQWALKESVRRTFLTAFFFSQTTRLATGTALGACTGRTASWNCWTLGADLWHAPDAVEFAQAWNASRKAGWDADGCGPIMVSPGQMQRVLREAKAEDMDDFARILLTTTLGVDEAKAWFASKGGTL